MKKINKNKILDIYCKFLAILRKDSIKYSHLFIEGDEIEVIIVASETGFRAYNTNTINYEIRPGEEVFPHAGLLTSKCKYCGKIKYNWRPYIDHYDKDLMEQLYPKE